MTETATGVTTMRAAFLIAPDVFALREVGKPEPGPGEVRLKVAVCGVCSSEVHAVRAMRRPAGSGYDIQTTAAGPQPGRREWQVRPVATAPAAQLPMLMGHEVSGFVDALGPGVSGVQVGQRVTALTQRGFADFALAPAANVIPLPDHLPIELALGEPIACAANAAQRAGVRLGDTVALVGAGFMGLLALQFLLRLGAARVIVIEPRATARDLAGQLGAGMVVDPAQQHAEAAVLEATAGAGADVVVEATGAQAGLDLATALTRTRGRLIIYGYHQGGPRTVDMQLWNLRGLDVVNAHQRSDDDYLSGMRAGLAMLAQGKLNMQALVTHRFSLEHVGKAFALAEQCPEGFVKAIVLAE